MNNLNPRKLYVGNIPSQYTEADLVKDFSPFGRIEQVEFKGRFCFVEYSSSACVSEALTNLGGMVRHGERLIVKAYRHIPPRSGYQGGHNPSVYDRGVGQSKRTSFRVAVLGLDDRTSWQDLKDFGRQVGEVNYADVTRGPNGQKKGILEFFDEASMASAIRRLSGQNFLGSIVEVIPANLANNFTSGPPPSISGKPVDSSGWGSRNTRGSVECKNFMRSRPDEYLRNPEHTHFKDSRINNFFERNRDDMGKPRERRDYSVCSSRVGVGSEAPVCAHEHMGSPKWNRGFRFGESGRNAYPDNHPEDSNYSVNYRHREPYRTAPMIGQASSRRFEVHNRASESLRSVPFPSERRDLMAPRRRSRSLRNLRGFSKRETNGYETFNQYDFRSNGVARGKELDFSRNRLYEKSDVFARPYSRRDLGGSSGFHRSNGEGSSSEREYSRTNHHISYNIAEGTRRSRSNFCPRLYPAEPIANVPPRTHSPHRRYFDSYPDSSFSRVSRLHGNQHPCNIPTLSSSSSSQKYLLSNNKPC